jgi:phage gpG-like protein
MPFTFDASGALAKLQRLKDNIQPALKAGAVSVLADAVLTVKNQGNGEWAPFKHTPSRPHNLLWDTGGLVQSMNVQAGILEVGSDWITIGSNLRYASVQQLGYSGFNIPARPFFTFDAGVQARAKSAFAKRLFQGL